MDNRKWRNLVQSKQGQSIVQTGVPRIKDLQEGKMYPRYTNEGIVIYVRYNDVLYKKVMDKDRGNESKAKSYWMPQWDAQWKTRYNDWYRPNHGVGMTYWQWNVLASGSVNTTASETLPTTYTDAAMPHITVPKACILKSYQARGYVETSDNTLELALLKGIPNYGTAGDTNLSQIGSTQSVDFVADVHNIIGETNLNVNLSEGEALYPFLRRTTLPSSSSTYWFYQTLNIVAEIL